MLNRRDAFCLFYDAKTKEVKALNGSGHSPQKLTIDYARSRGIKTRSIPLTDLNSVTVPGTPVIPDNNVFSNLIAVQGPRLLGLTLLRSLAVASLPSPKSSILRLDSRKKGEIMSAFCSIVSFVLDIASVPVSEIHSYAVGL